MSTLVKNILRFVLLILVQFYILDKVNLHRMVVPYIYFLFIIWMPFSLGRAWQMILAFILGLTLDSFRHNPGFHAAACVLIAYLRPFLINVLIPQEGADTNYDEPSARSMGGLFPYMVYAGLLTLIHHGWLFFLEAMEFGNFWYFIIKTLLSTIITLCLIFIAELMFSRKQKFRTNTA
jgi:rod shape-determining protein MreD